MHPAVYMMLTKVLIKSDARHSLPLDPLDNIWLYFYIHKITLCSFMTDGLCRDGWRQVCLQNLTVNAHVSCHNANVSLM